MNKMMRRPYTMYAGMSPSACCLLRIVDYANTAEHESSRAFWLSIAAMAADNIFCGREVQS